MRAATVSEQGKAQTTVHTAEMRYRRRWGKGKGERGKGKGERWGKKKSEEAGACLTAFVVARSWSLALAIASCSVYRAITVRKRQWQQGPRTRLHDPALVPSLCCEQRSMVPRLTLVVLLGLAVSSQAARTLDQPVHTRSLSSASDHKYQADEEVPLWASKVGPYTNPR